MRRTFECWKAEKQKGRMMDNESTHVHTALAAQRGRLRNIDKWLWIAEKREEVRSKEIGKVAAKTGVYSDKKLRAILSRNWIERLSLLSKNHKLEIRKFEGGICAIRLFVITKGDEMVIRFFSFSNWKIERFVKSEIESVKNHKFSFSR